MKEQTSQWPFSCAGYIAFPTPQSGAPASLGAELTKVQVCFAPYCLAYLMVSCHLIARLVVDLDLPLHSHALGACPFHASYVRHLAVKW